MVKLFRDELLLDGNSFKEPKKLEDLEALAQTIQNIIIINPGTYPSDPRLGVGIGNYLFEFMDSITINEITSNIEKQIDMFVVHPDISVNVSVKELNSSVSSSVKGLYIEISLYSIEDENATSINLVVAGNTSTKKIISKFNY